MPDNTPITPITPPVCMQGDQDCYRLFSTLITQVNLQGSKIDRMCDALLGGDFNPEEGLILQVKKIEKRVRILEKIYIGAVAVVTVGGVVLGIINKLGITLK